MPTPPLTPRQKEILELIEKSVRTLGYPPTQREIASHFGFAGTRAVEKHLNALIVKGVLRKGAGRRTWEIVDRSLIGKGAEISGRLIPILGRIAAGRPILAEENRIGNLIVDPSLARWSDPYLLKVSGQSMQGAGILDGDLVLVKPQSDADSGDIIVALLEDEATVKRLIRKRGAVILQPENPAFEPIVITKTSSAQIIGKVTGVFRI